MGALSRIGRACVAGGSALAAAGTVHAWWNLRRLRTLPTDGDADRRLSLSVLVPARDEAGRIGHCLTSMRAQVGVDIVEIVVLDDRSSDGTAQVVRRHLDDPRVRLVTASGEPPPGWLGKTWACHQLAEQASGDVMVFVDADVVLDPGALARVATALAAGDVDAVSPYPRQVSVSWAERIVQPLLQWSWATLLPLRAAETSDRTSLVAANGQLLAITRSAYDACGGHQAIRGEVLDDVALFRALKRVGRRGALADGTDVASCHMYDGWAELRDGYGKSLWAATGSPARAAAIAGVLSAAYVLPPLAMLLRGSRVGAFGYAAAVGGRALVAHRTGGRVWPDSLLHPASIATFDYLLARSWLGRIRGRLTWKGRPLP